MRAIEKACSDLPELRAWDGIAHEAALAMFQRAHKSTAELSDYASAVADALNGGAESIGSARIALLDKAIDIERGPLYVTNEWVVLIREAMMSAEQAAELQALAEAEQQNINHLLVAVGQADSTTASKVQTAAKKFGFVAPGPNSLDIASGQVPAQPGDEVPNPLTIQGLAQQGAIRAEDMGVTVRERTEIETEEGDFITTLTMQDGSKQVITEWNSWHMPSKLNFVEVEHFAKDGSFISRTSSWMDSPTYGASEGTKTTSVTWADNSNLVVTETADGYRTAGITTANGRHAPLPPDNPILTGAFPQVLGGAFTGLDAHVGRGGSIPMLTAESVQHAGTTAKFAGPALGLAGAAYNVFAAETATQACVGGISGVFAVGGDYVGGQAGVWAAGWAGVATGPAAPVAVPLFAVAGALGGQYALGSLGSTIGEAICK